MSNKKNTLTPSDVRKIWTAADKKQASPNVRDDGALPEPAAEVGTKREGADAKRMARVLYSRTVKEDFFEVGPDFLRALGSASVPVDFYEFKQGIDSMQRVYKAETPLDAETSKHLLRLCRKGVLFVSKKQRAGFLSCMAEQFDLLLAAPDLRPAEAARIFYDGFTRRIHGLGATITPEQVARLDHDAAVFAEWVLAHPTTLNELVRLVHANPVAGAQDVNTAIIAATLYARAMEEALDVASFKQAMLAFCLHDVGMARVSDSVLQAKKELGYQEIKQIQRHPMHAREMLKKAAMADKDVLRCCLEHHERLDGTGYPSKLRGHEICLHARICAIADSYMAMLSAKDVTERRKPVDAARELVRDSRRYDQSLASLLVTILQ